MYLLDSYESYNILFVHGCFFKFIFFPKSWSKQWLQQQQQKTKQNSSSPPIPKSHPPASLSVSLLTCFWRCWAADKHVSKHLKLKKTPKKTLINGVALLGT